MIIKKILLLGGSGFIGSSLAEQLTGCGYFVTLPTRRYARAKHLSLLPTIDIVESDIHNEADLFNLMQGQDAVINLVGILHGDFEREHVAFPKLVAETCVKAGVPRFIHMSSLNADANGPSQYLRSRGRGEAAVWTVAKNNPSLKVTIFQPSIVYGEHDKFLNMFMRLVKFFPLIPLGSPDAKFQPVWVGDVVRAMATSVSMYATEGATYPLVGPKTYTLKELIKFVIGISGKARVVVGLPASLSMLQATIFQCLPGKLITRDNVLSMRVPSTSDVPFPAIFGAAHNMESMVKSYLAGTAGRARYPAFRAGGGV
jgi:uncharacterized protein YbjT (DUF2867 family)